MQNMSPKPPKPSVGNGKSIMMIVVIVLVVVVVALLGIMVYPNVKDKKATSKVEEGIESDAYYAVFLSNGQVYFGHLANITESYPELTDIYYLQLNQQQQQQQAQVQPAEGDQPELQEQTQEKDPELSLVKLGKELHGPEDKMVLNGEHILFYEKLTEDSNVVKAIGEDKEKEE